MATAPEGAAPEEDTNRLDTGDDNLPSKASQQKSHARQQRLANHLHAAGPRPVLEALRAVVHGQALDDVLEDFGRIPVEIYREVGASDFPPLALVPTEGA